MQTDRPISLKYTCEDCKKKTDVVYLKDKKWRCEKCHKKHINNLKERR